VDEALLEIYSQEEEKWGKVGGTTMTKVMKALVRERRDKGCHQTE